MKTAGLILAAGQSSRMNQQKALLPWGDKTLIEWEITCLKSVGIQNIFVVVGSKYSNILGKIKELNVNPIINHNWAKGRDSSILCGVEEILSKNHNTKIDQFLIQNVDQPLTIEIISEIMDFVDSQKTFEVIQPSFNNKKRHPIVLHIDQANKLLDIQNYKMGLRDIIEGLDIKTIEVNSALLNINLNYMSDYYNALKEFKI
jgi:molybdenum cofactor cytidylyltransferase